MIYSLQRMGNIERKRFEIELENILKTDESLKNYGKLCNALGYDVVVSGLEKIEAVSKGPCLIISNHPGSLDLASIVFALYSYDNFKRDDIQILVSQTTYPFYLEYFDERHFLKATDEPRKVASLIANISSYIDKGGIFVMFPSKRNSPDQYKQIVFESGLGYTLRCLDNKTTVASFSIRYANSEISLALDVHEAGWWKNGVNFNLGNFEINKTLSAKYVDLHTSNLNN